MLLHFNEGRPVYRQLYQALRQAILSGDLAPGTKLPSTREQAAQLGISRNTVVLAYDQLLAEGYTQAVTGSGTFVASALPDARPQAGSAPTNSSSNGTPRFSTYGLRVKTWQPKETTEDLMLPYNFRYGRIAVESKMLDLWKRALASSVKSIPLGYGPPMGHLPLRHAIADYLKRNRGVVCRAEQILVTNGSQQALDLVARVLLERGDSVLIEEPHYQGARHVFLANGATLVPGALDSHGIMLPHDTPEVKLIYITPSHQFPTGVVMPLSRRLELLSYAEQSNAYIIEDDYDAEYRYEGKPMPAVQGLDTSGRVIYVGTFSKVLFPALRLGFLVLPEPLLEVFEAAKWQADRHSSTLEQAALAKLMTDGHFERHLRRTRMQNAKRRMALMTALEVQLHDRVEVEGTNAGIHVLVWLKTVPIEQQAELVAQARAVGVGIYPISPYYLRPPRHLGLLMGYAALDEEAIRSGISRLARLIKSLLR